jgi:hypothetical protein
MLMLLASNDSISNPCHWLHLRRHPALPEADADLMNSKPYFNTIDVKPIYFQSVASACAVVSTTPCGHGASFPPSTRFFFLPPRELPSKNP